MKQLNYRLCLDEPIVTTWDPNRKTFFGWHTYVVLPRKEGKS